ncbi:MAG: ParB N-terminal domain-containing protein [Phycisphaerae bacterium]|nr:ParB N-terminal domain-containing protein [Phycisphaerae bacterium]
MTNLGDSRFELLPVEDLQLDFDNPRIAQWIKIYGEPPTAEQIALALGAGSSQGENAGPSFLALKQSILTNKGIIHPILVNRTQSQDLVVIEGNTRTQIYREFLRDDIPGGWSRIPALVYDQLTQEAIDAIRLQAHLVGVRQWDPYSKARYLNHLRNQQHLTLSQIIDYCGGDKREVVTYIDAYNDMQKYYVQVLESDQDFDPSRFSAFVELQSPRVQTAIVQAGFTKEDFARWVHERRLFPLNTIRKLPRILQHNTSRQAFLRDGAQEAIRILDAGPPEAQLADCSLQDIASEICRRISEYPYHSLQRLKASPDCDEVLMLREARDALIEFCEDIGEDAE